MPALASQVRTGASARRPQPLGHRRFRTTSTVSARVERMYVAAVSFALGVAGTAIGFSVGVLPYFRATLDMSQYDWFFASSLAICTATGFIVGVLNGAKWYRSTEASPLIQRRMLAYMERRAATEAATGVRTVNVVTLRSLLGKKA